MNLPTMRKVFPIASLLLLACSLAPAQTNTTKASPDITDLSIEDLVDVRVISVSKHLEDLWGSAAAIHVLPASEIRRQGFTSIADSLRTVPGIQVAQINSHTWGISSRGFNAEYATKLLVLNDGRSVYTPLNAGVYWDTLDTTLDDLDRIEVIRGPGATLWGANAVNGVINVISKSAKETQGTLLNAGGGSELRGFFDARYGGQLATNAWLRVYAKYDDHDDTAFGNGSSGEDEWMMERTGFRLDWEASEDDRFTFQGDAYAGQSDWLYNQPIANAPFSETRIFEHDYNGANLLGRWTHMLADSSEIKVQAYYDRSERESNLPREERDTADLEIQHHFQPIARHDVVWGVGYRLSMDDIHNSYANQFLPTHRSVDLFSLFAQDEVTLVEDQLRLALGSKFEHNDFTGFEFQPSGRLAWTPSPRQTIWGAISRAVRTPSRAEDDVRINRAAPGLPGSVVSILGDRAGESEELVAYELGYRVLPHPRISLDATAFYNVYDELRSLEPGAPPAAPPAPLATYYVRNMLEGKSWGAELSVDWQMLKWWRWRGSYSYFEMALRAEDGGTDLATARLLEGNAPRNQISLRSQMDLPHNVEFDAGLRFVDSLSNPDVAAYWTLDLRLSWKPHPDVELSVVGLNLLDSQHLEFYPTQVVTPPREIQRSVYGKISWRF